MRRMALRSQAGDFVRASRAAARRAWSRIDGRGAPPPAPEAPQWLRRGLALLPEEARTALRAALGPERGAEATSEALRRLEGRAAELRHRQPRIQPELELLTDRRGLGAGVGKTFRDDASRTPKEGHSCWEVSTSS